MRQEECYVEQMQEKLWVLLVYKIPREPTASRAQVWRKLKRLGALLLHDAVWVLPATPWTREQFQWLAVEIGELGGEAHLWESHLLLAELGISDGGLNRWHSLLRDMSKILGNFF